MDSRTFQRVRKAVGEAGIPLRVVNWAGDQMAFYYDRPGRTYHHGVVVTRPAAGCRLDWWVDEARRALALVEGMDRREKARMSPKDVQQAITDAGLKVVIRQIGGHYYLSLPGRGDVKVPNPYDPDCPHLLGGASRISQYSVEDWVEQAWIAQMKLLLETPA